MCVVCILYIVYSIVYNVCVYTLHITSGTQSTLNVFDMRISVCIHYGKNWNVRIEFSSRRMYSKWSRTIVCARALSHSINAKLLWWLCFLLNLIRCFLLVQFVHVFSAVQTKPSHGDSCGFFCVSWRRSNLFAPFSVRPKRGESGERSRYWMSCRRRKRRNQTKENQKNKVFVTAPDCSPLHHSTRVNRCILNHKQKSK